MNRVKIIATLIATLVAFAALPAVPAFASAASKARLVQGTDVFPGALRTYKITVTNSEVSSLLATGKSINYIRIQLPSGQGVKTVVSPLPATPAGWKAPRVSTTANHITYDATGTGLAPGAAITLEFPASVARPAAGDRKGDFSVSVSSDAGQTTSVSTVDSTLSTMIRVLEVTNVQPVSPLGATAPVGYEDGTGTARQQTEWAVTVKNHATSALSVLPALRSTNNDTITNPTTATSVAGNDGTATTRIPVTLANVAADKPTTFTGSAKAEDGKSTTTTAIGEFQAGYIVQAAPYLEFQSATFKPTDIMGNRSYTFEIDTIKRNNPSLQLLSGSVVFRSPTGAATAPVAIDALTSFADATAQTLKFTAPATLFAALENPADPKSFRYTDGKYDAEFTFTGKDGNGFTDLDLNETVADVLTLDRIAPILDMLPLDLPSYTTDGVTYEQTRVKDGDAVIVKGTLDDSTAVLGEVGLEVVETGKRYLCPTTGTGALTRTGNTFTCTVKPTFESVGKVDATGKPVLDSTGKQIMIAAGKVHGFGIATDKAGNSDSDGSDDVEIDNQKPTLAEFAYVMANPDVDVNPFIVVQFDDNFAVLGGCSPRSYSVDGQLLVKEVRYYGAKTTCAGEKGKAGPTDNRRVLILSEKIDRGGSLPTPTVSYDPMGAHDGPDVDSPLSNDDVHDAAAQFIGETLRQTQNLLQPLAPSILKVTRNNNTEDAYYDDPDGDSGSQPGTYYTRFATNPTNANAADLRVSVDGALNGDTFEVFTRDAQGKETIHAAVKVIDNSGEATVALPIAAAQDAVQTFQLRFKSPTQVPGLETPFRIVFDALVPKSLKVERTGITNNVVQTFDDELIGSNFARHWSVIETQDSEENVRSANKVSGSRETRTVEGAFQGGTFTATIYEFDDNGQQFEDFAGNKLVSPVRTNVAAA